jgi:hypothetical protein
LATTSGKINSLMEAKTLDKIHSFSSKVNFLSNQDTKTGISTKECFLEQKSIFESIGIKTTIPKQIKTDKINRHTKKPQNKTQEKQTKRKKQKQNKKRNQNKHQNKCFIKRVF